MPVAVVQSRLTLCDLQQRPGSLPCPSLSPRVWSSLLRLMSIESVMLSNHLILCHPFLLLPSIFPSIRVFSDESALWIKWPKYWSFSFSLSPSNEYPGLISFRVDWFDLHAVHGTLKSLLQNHSLKYSVERGGGKDGAIGDRILAISLNHTGAGIKKSQFCFIPSWKFPYSHWVLLCHLQMKKLRIIFLEHTELVAEPAVKSCIRKVT